MFAGGHLSERDRQRQYVIQMYEGGAPCPACGKIQTPWAACGLDTKTWIDTSPSTITYHCVECGIELRHDVYLMGGWGWGNPAVIAHK